MVCDECAIARSEVYEEMNEIIKKLQQELKDERQENYELSENLRMWSG